MLSADQALDALMAGNRRYVHAGLTHPRQTLERRQEVAAGQHPFAVVLGCSDSRVPPEIIFDQGLGDLFVIRVPGNVVDEIVTDSIEFAASAFGVGLILVLGHTRCGAVKAAMGSGEASGPLRSVIEAIKPAMEAVKGQPGDLLGNAARANVKLVVDHLRTSPTLGELTKQDKLKIVGGYYDLNSGTVEIIA